MPSSARNIRTAIASLLDQREPPATICPSEVARTLAPDAWRPLMQEVRAEAIAMAKEGLLEVRQRGKAVALDEPLRGPIRLGRRGDAAHEQHPTTPDGRYFVVRGRLWRKTNPALAEDVREALVKKLMDARRALRGRKPQEERRVAREQVEQAKRALGERGPVWWTDGAPDFNRKMAVNTPYRAWFEQLEDASASPPAKGGRSGSPPSRG